MKKLILIASIFCLTTGAFAQEEKEANETGLRKNAFYLELGGNGGNYSVNYDRIVLSGKRTHLSFRGGLSISHFEYRLPIELNILFGKSKNYFELGFGETLDMNTNRAGGGFGFNHAMPFLRIGYRLQKDINEGGFLFRAGFTPTLLEYEGSYVPFPFAGLSFGYAF